MKKIGINGFGRIGRLALRVILQKFSDRIEVPIINTSGSMDTKGWAHIFEFDTMYRRFPGSVEVDGDYMIVNGKRIFVSAEREPENIPWGDYGVETVLESTGVFEDERGMSKHLRGSVKQVILSAPGKGEGIQTVVKGVNDEEAKGKTLVSNASCTTNCISPVSKVMLENFTVKKAAMTTIHAFTSDQSLQDGSHKKDLRRARSASQNVIPTSTGAAIAMTKVLPQLKGKFDGIAIRVPVATASLSDLTYLVDRPTTVEEVNEMFIEASKRDELKYFLYVTQKPLVSSDIIGCEASAVVDLSLTQVIDGDLVKVYAWYDNEWGYANRLVEQVLD
ncbi:MAG: type I glyceraldehyde-3-phosphate dehydrogenase [Patescibacteria group bacterium]|jgi:glyceraldehyde 3-phosphate dehydrogenase